MTINLSKNTLIVLEKYNQYFEKYTHHLVDGWGKSGNDLKGVKIAISFLYKSANYEKEEFCEFLDSGFQKPWTEEHQEVISNLVKFFNRCHENNLEKNLPISIKSAIKENESSFNPVEVREQIADYFKEKINGFLQKASPDFYAEIEWKEMEEISRQKIEKERKFIPILEEEISNKHLDETLETGLYINIENQAQEELSSLITYLTKPSTSPSRHILKPLAQRNSEIKMENW